MNWPWQTPEPGIYLDMDFETYLDIPCLSASGIKDLCVSRTQFWANSWMNKTKSDRQQTEAQKTGSAYHKRVVEGKEAFYSEYAPDFEPDPDTHYIKTAEELRGELAKVGAKTTFKRKSEGEERLLEADPNAKIYDWEERLHRAQYGEDKEFLSPDLVRQMELGCSIINNHPQLRTYFAGGFPEVTIIWDDPELGARFKMRADYLKVGPVVDLKTFANQMGKRLDRAVYHDIAGNRYHIQAALYMRGANMGKILAREGCVYTGDGEIVDTNTDWWTDFINTTCREMRFLFLKKGASPDVQGARLFDDRGLAASGRECIRGATQEFSNCYNEFGEAPWINHNAEIVLDDSEVPAFAYDV